MVHEGPGGIRAAAGDHSMMDGWIRDHRPAVVRTARHLLGDAALAEDVAQDVFVRLQGAFEAFRGDADVGTWLYRVTLNRCRDVLRRERPRWKERSPVDIAAATGLSNDQGPDASLERMDSERRQRLVRAAVDRLPGEQREAVLLRYEHDLSYDEIARATGVPRGTVASRVFRALAKLGDDLTTSDLEWIP